MHREGRAALLIAETGSVMPHAMRTACVTPAPAPCFVLRGAYGLLRRERDDPRAAGPHEGTEGRKVLTSNLEIGISCHPFPVFARVRSCRSSWCPLLRSTGHACKKPLSILVSFFLD